MNRRLVQIQTRSFDDEKVSGRVKGIEWPEIEKFIGETVKYEKKRQRKGGIG